MAIVDRRGAGKAKKARQFKRKVPKEPKTDSVHSDEAKTKKKRKLEAAPPEAGSESAMPQDEVTPSEPKNRKKKAKKSAEAEKERPVQPFGPTLRSHVDSTFLEDSAAFDLDAAPQFAASSPEAKTQELCEWLLGRFPKWLEWVVRGKTDTKAAPLVLFVTSSAIRAVNLSRELADFKTKQCVVAKLFSKHMKKSEQAAFLATHSPHLGIGTPQRILDLLADGSLSLARLRGVVVDWSWADVKRRRLGDMSELHGPLSRLLLQAVLPKVTRPDFQCLLI